MTRKNILARVALIGVVSGLRSQTGTAAVALTTDIGEKARPASLLAGRWARRITATAAAGELAGDKLPMTPSRLSPPGVVSRMAFGALAAAALSQRQPGYISTAAAGALGAAAAVGGTFAGAGWRRAVHHSGRPDWPAALIEDLAALTLAFTACAVHRTAGGPTGLALRDERLRMHGAAPEPE
jgi:uncharacterized membrane protein